VSIAAKRGDRMSVYRYPVLFCLLLAACAPAPGDRPPVYADTAAIEVAGPLAVIGDLQRTSFPERVIGREQNDPERRRIVAAVAGERPAAVVLLGDMVATGSSRAQWERFDALMEPIRALGCPVLAVPGNHDYTSDIPTAVGRLEARFPQLARCRWYVRRFGGLALVCLDSNRLVLGPDPWRRQIAWFADTVAELDRDPQLRAVLVFVHHPPFTNSAVTGDERDVQEAFLPAFGAGRKTLALFSGHAHAYEHFRRGGKHYFVCGGGGGPRVRLLTGPEQRHRDLHTGPSPRPFHYVLVRAEDAGVGLVVKGFGKGEDEVRVIESLLLEWPTGKIVRDE
jgi:hypothetical protein